MVNIGRIVHFVTNEGNHRPAIVVEVWNKETGCSNLQVFTDGFNDSKGRKQFDQPQNVSWATSVNYSEEPKPYTWHWPEREEA